MPLILGEDEKIFMNGYQTWTGCPEYSRRDKIRRCHLPRFINEKFGIDRYGDYFFVDYPEKAGVTHGESYCYFRAGQRYRLFASLDERPGYTLFQYDARAGLLSISRDCAAAGNFTPSTSLPQRAAKMRSLTAGLPPWA